MRLLQGGINSFGSLLLLLVTHLAIGRFLALALKSLLFAQGIGLSRRLGRLGFEQLLFLRRILQLLLAHLGGLRTLQQTQGPRVIAVLLQGKPGIVQRASKVPGVKTALTGLQKAIELLLALPGHHLDCNVAAHHHCQSYNCHYQGRFSVGGRWCCGRRRRWGSRRTWYRCWRCSRYVPGWWSTGRCDGCFGGRGGWPSLGFSCRYRGNRCGRLL
ncbi:hypothetical protein GHN92_18800 [Pseudomonas sp. FSL R10-2964]|nr:hypothetical protein [Pseudomonas sp. FSL R10-2964]